MIKQNNMNKNQFKLLAESRYIKLKLERIGAVEDVIFNGLTPSAAEKKHNLCSGTIQRDVNRVNKLYETCINIYKERKVIK